MVGECVASSCWFPGTISFTVTEDGCLGGRLRRIGEEVHACAGHAEDINRSQDGRGLPLAEWLREDARHHLDGRVAHVRVKPDTDNHKLT